MLILLSMYTSYLCTEPTPGYQVVILTWFGQNLRWFLWLSFPQISTVQFNSSKQNDDKIRFFKEFYSYQSYCMILIICDIISVIHVKT